MSPTPPSGASTSQASLISRVSLLFLILLPLLILAFHAYHGVSADQAMLKVMSCTIGILAAFTVLIGFLRKKGKRSAPELMARALTFWWMLAGFLVAATTPRPCSLALLGWLCCLALREFFTLTRQQGASVWLAYLGLLGAVSAAYLGMLIPFLIIVPVVFGLLGPILLVLRNEFQGTTNALALAASGSLYFTFALGHAFFLVDMGLMVLVYVFFLTEMRDLLSYWLGKGISATGLRLPLLDLKIAASISPNKTWAVGIASVLLTAWISSAFVGVFPDFPRGKFSVGYSWIVGALIGFFGLMGDLVFSMLKRDQGVKDSGDGMPGGSGVIDRVDSLVFTIPVAFHLLYWRYF